MKQKILIAGGGVAGFTVATLLAEAGFKVTILEKSEHIGGKAITGRTTDGKPWEHSLRIFTSYYQRLFTLLARIPNGKGGFILDHLIKVNKTAVFQTGSPLFAAPPAPIPRPWGPIRTAVFRIWWRLTLPITLPFRLLLFIIAFNRKGIPVSELLGYAFRHLRVVFYPEKKRHEKLGHLSYIEFLDMAGKSEAYRKYFVRLPQILTAARLNAEASSVAIMIARLFFGLTTPPYGFEHMPNISMLDGPTDERMLLPWQRYLVSLGVDIQTNTNVTDILNDGNQVLGFQLQSGEILTADVYVSALPFIAIRQMAAQTQLSRLTDRLGALDKIQPEWSHGIQLFLSGLPETDLAHLHPGVPAMYMDSPWCFSSVIQGAGFWKDVDLPAGTQFIFSATWSNAQQPGVGNGKVVTACNLEEIIEETLLQCNAEALRPFINEGYMSTEIEYMDSGQYEAEKDTMDPHLDGAPYNNRKMLLYAPIIVQLPGYEDNPPTVRTGIPNFFLTGEYVYTFCALPTMERSAEAGFAAAEAILEDLAPELSHNIRIDYDPLPFRWVRNLLA
jgi:uncharacterized protein with NAD-binding domain and iron-sulfur cluster